MAKAGPDAPPPGGELKQHVRLLLSWREQALRNQGAPEEPEALLEQFRRQGQQRLQFLAAALKAALRKQADCLKEVEAGGISERKAQQRLQRLTEEINHHRAQITLYNRLLSAKSPEDLGGFIHLPLDQYPRELARSKKPAFTKLNRRDKRQAAAFLLLALLAVLAVACWSRAHGEVRFGAAAPHFPNGKIHLRCQNNTSSEIFFHAPWGQSAEQQRFRNDYGVEVLARLPGKNEYRLVPSGDAWRYNSLPANTLEPIRVAPGLAIEIELDLRAIFQQVPGADALRLICTQGNGRSVYRFDTKK